MDPRSLDDISSRVSASELRATRRERRLEFRLASLARSRRASQRGFRAVARGDGGVAFPRERRRFFLRRLRGGVGGGPRGVQPPRRRHRRRLRRRRARFRVRDGGGETFVRLRRFSGGVEGGGVGGAFIRVVAIGERSERRRLRRCFRRGRSLRGERLFRLRETLAKSRRHR